MLYCSEKPENIYGHFLYEPNMGCWKPASWKYRLCAVWFKLAVQKTEYSGQTGWTSCIPGCWGPMSTITEPWNWPGEMRKFFSSFKVNLDKLRHFNLQTWYKCTGFLRKIQHLKGLILSAAYFPSILIFCATESCIPTYYLMCILQS